MKLPSEQPRIIQTSVYIPKDHGHKGYVPYLHCLIYIDSFCVSKTQKKMNIFQIHFVNLNKPDSNLDKASN